MPTSRLRRKHRRGLTLPELLVASAVTALIAMGASTMAVAVHTAQDYAGGRTQAAQHGRVTLSRIQQAVEASYGNEVFPCCVVFAAAVGAYDFPDALVVWKPTGSPAAPTGLPKNNELVIYAPDPAAPNRLLECTRPTDTASAPAMTSTSAWFSLITKFTTNSDSTKTELTDLLRAGASSTTASSQRGAVRFNVFMNPTEAEWASYRGGSSTFTSLSWPLDQRGQTSGKRRVVCQTELQIAVPSRLDSHEILPFFGSASRTYLLSQ